MKPYSITPITTGRPPMEPAQEMNASSSPLRF